MDELFAPLELKFVDSTPAGEFSGYASVHGNVDAHGDVVVPNAFTESLNERKAQGRGFPPMRMMHGSSLGADPRPVGTWTSIEEDTHGLKVTGKISGLDTEAGRYNYALIRDGAMRGLSIGYRIKPNGAVHGKNAAGVEGAKRALTNLSLAEISIVDDASNAEARVTELKALKASETLEMKTVLGLIERDKAAQAVADAIGMCMGTMSGGDSPTADERKAMLQRLQDAHEVITGTRMPSGMKAVPETIREFEAAVRTIFGISNKQARALAEHGFKALAPRDEEDKQATAAVEEEMKSSLSDLTNFAAGFSLMGA